MLCEGIQPTTRIICIYKDLQKSFFLTLQRKVVVSESQLQTELASMQARMMQFGRFYASITRIENRQLVISQGTRKHR